MTITKKMAACTFYQNALWAARKTPKENFCKTKKITSPLMFVLQQTSICFLKRFEAQCIVVKCTSAFFFITVSSSICVKRMVRIVIDKHFQESNECWLRTSLYAMIFLVCNA